MDKRSELLAEAIGSAWHLERMYRRVDALYVLALTLGSALCLVACALTPFGAFSVILYGSAIAGALGVRATIVDAHARRRAFNAAIAEAVETMAELDRDT